MRIFLLIQVLLSGLLAMDNQTNYFLTVSSQLPECQLAERCGVSRYPDHALFTCYTFWPLNDLNYTNCAFIGPTDSVAYIELFFQSEVVLSNGLPIILGLIDFLRQDAAHVMLYFNNLPGIDITFFADLNSVSLNFRVFLEIGESDLALYHQGVDILKPENCNSDTYNFVLPEDKIDKLIAIALSRTKLTDKKLCKYIFQSMTLDRMEVYQSDLGFYEDTNSTLINTTITTLIVSQVYRIQLDLRFLQPEVFARIQSLEIDGSSVLRIQEDLFNLRFVDLRLFKLGIINIRGLLHSQNGIKWLEYLNLNIKPINLAVGYATQPSRLERFLEDFMILIIFLVKTNDNTTQSVKLFPYLEYQFPDEDICLFKNLPFERAVFVEIGGLVNFSCTVEWLVQYEYLYLPDYITPVHNRRCNFTSMFKKCEQNLTNYQSDPYFVFSDISQVIITSKKVLVGYIGPVMSGFGLITNMLVILTIIYNHKRRHEIRTQKDQEIVMLEQPFYKYILFNSVINSIYLLMYMLDYAIPCTQPKSIFGHMRNCLFSNIVVDLIGSYLKILSNLSLLQISLNRYLLVGKNQSERLIKTAQITVRRFFIYTSIIAIIFSVIVYFQKTLFIVKTFSDQGTEEYYYGVGYDHFYLWGYMFRDENYRELMKRLSELPILTAFTVIHDLFSYFFFCLVSLIIDVLTVKRLHEALLEKTKLKGSQERKKNRESERKGIMMVVLNSLSNIVFRAPELVSIVFYYIVTHDGGYVFKMLCWTYSSCLVFVDIANVFFIMSLCFNFLFYFKFNSNFNCSFNVLTASANRILFCRIK